MENKRLRVAMIAPVPPPYGGIGNWVLLLDEYAKNRSNIQFLHINTAPVSRGLDGRSLWDRVVTQGFVMFRLRKELKRHIKNNEIDVVHITTSGQMAIIRDIVMLKVAKKMSIPTVYHIRFGRIPEIASKNNREWKLIHKAMKLSDQVIAIDHNTEKAIHKYTTGVNVCYVPNPFDISKASEQQRDKLRKVVIYIGWVVKTKGVEELLQAWGKIHSRFGDWILKIVGPYSEDYLSYLKTTYPQEQVEFAGEQKHDDAMAMLSQASVFTLPSYTEGFPNVVLEAMAFGKPIVATDVGAIPDMLQGCGMVIPKQDVEALESSLVKLMENPTLCEKFGKSAKQKIEQEYSIDRVFNKYLDLWRKRVK